jgi:PAS domain S-box-containing protein
LQQLCRAPRYEDALQDRQSGILNSLILVFGLVLAFAFCVSLPFIYIVKLPSAVALLAFSALLYMIWRLHRARQLRLAMVLMLSGLYTIFACLAALSGSVYSPNLAYFPGLAVVAGLLFGVRGAWLTGFFGLLVVVVLVLLELLGLGPPRLFPVPPVAVISTYLFATIFTISPLLLSVGNLNKALRRARAELRHRQRSELALRCSEERFRTIFDSLDELLVIHDAKSGAIIDSNDGSVRLLGYTFEEAMRFAPDAISEEDDANSRALAMVHAAARGKSVTFEWRVRKRSGEVLTLEVQLQPIELDGRSCVLASGRDISQRKREQAQREQLEQQLRHAQKLDSIGRLAGGIAHDFNNMLTGILGHVAYARERGVNSDELFESLTAIEESTLEAAALSRRLLALARNPSYCPVLVELPALVEAVVRILSRSFGSSIRIRVKFDEGLSPVLCDRHQLEQVLVNLALNARDAMPHGGVLCFEGRQRWVEHQQKLRHGCLSEGHWVELCVRDSGAGMSEACMSQLFEPFFTTKAQGKGTGLGLTTVLGFVKQAKLGLEVRSRRGEGSSFSLFFPVGSPLRSSQRIAVVEEDELCRLISSVLGRRGYELCCFASREALSRALESEQSGEGSAFALLIHGDAYGGTESELGAMPVLRLCHRPLGTEPVYDATQRAWLLTKPFDVTRLLRAVELALEHQVPDASGVTSPEL